MTISPGLKVTMKDDCTTLCAGAKSIAKGQGVATSETTFDVELTLRCLGPGGGIVPIPVPPGSVFSFTCNGEPTPSPACRRPPRGLGPDPDPIGIVGAAAGLRTPDRRPLPLSRSARGSVS